MKQSRVIFVDKGNWIIPRLECMASFTLHGEVTSMEKVTLGTNSPRDVFLLSFADAKLR